MKNLIRMVAVMGMVCAFTAVLAQSSTRADKVIQTSKKKFDSAKDVSADFTYTLSNPNMNKPIVKKGQVLFKKNNMYRISFPDVVMVCDGKYIWQLLVDDEELIKTDYTADAMSPENIFNVYKGETKSRYDGEEGGMDKVTLFANNKTADIWKTELWINKSDKMPGKAKMFARNGSTYEYSMSGIKTNTGISDDTFQLDERKYEDDGLIITDLTE